MLKYLKEAALLELCFPPEGDTSLRGFADADFAVTADETSISGSVMTLGGDAVFAWRSKK